MSQHPIKTALASFGMSGRVFHGPFLKAFPEYDVIKILERSKTESKTMFPNAQIVRDYDAILSDESIELIVVNTPNYLHYEMVKKGLLAGKHIVVEKPFTTTSDEARELIQLAQDKNKVVSVYHNRRWDSDFLTIKHLIDSDALGAISYYEAHFDRYRPDIGPKKWKEAQYEGAGILYDLGSHLIDQALVLFGMPDSVSAEIEIQRKNGVVPDHFLLKFNYPEKEVVLTAGMMVENIGPKYIVKGEKGTFTKYGQDTQEQALIDGESIENSTFGTEPTTQWGNLNGKIIPSLKGNYNHFYKALACTIRENKKAPVLPTEALNVIVLIEEAIKRSQEHLAN